MTRFRIVKPVSTRPYLKVQVQLLDVPADDQKASGSAVTVRQRANRVITLSPNVPEEASVLLENIEDPSALADFLAANIGVEFPEEAGLLEELDPAERLETVSVVLPHQLEVLELSHKIQGRVRESIDKSQREYFLQEQLKAIQTELGQEDDRTEELRELREKIAKAKMPKSVEEEALRELDRLEKIPAASPEYSVIRTYLDWVCELPWSVQTEDQLDITRPSGFSTRPLRPGQGQEADPRVSGGAQAQSHRQEPDPVLRRARRAWARPRSASPSPGRWAASSSACRWAAFATRPIFAAIAAPTSAPCPAGSCRKSARPAAATRCSCSTSWTRSARISAATRPAPCSKCWTRSRTTRLPTTISTCRSTCPKVMFIGTANYAEPMPPALRDRMEVIELPGYTTQEKLNIAKKYLVPRQLKENGLKEAQLTIKDEALAALIASYTREAGVRNWNEISARFAARSRPRSPGATRSSGRSAKRTSHEFSARPSSSPSSPCGPACPAWRPAWRTRPSAARSSSSRRPPCRARATCCSPARSAT